MNRPSSPSLIAALNYAGRGWCVVPVPYRKKRPVISGWEELRLTEQDLPQYFNGQAQNIGVHMGEPSAQLIDADLDNSHAVRLAPQFLPRTAAVFGRRGKQRSHWLYIITGPLPDTKKWLDPVKSTDGEGAMLLEFRSTGAQTIMPGSAHEETGEPIEWASDGKPTLITGADLLAHMNRLATATLLARHWPGAGGRQEAALALAGGLERAGWSNDDTSEFVGLVAGAAGDEEARKRADTAKHTRRRLDNDRHAYGWPHLAKLVGDPVVDKVREWLGLRSQTATGDNSHNSLISQDAPWPEPLAEEAYHGMTGEVVRAIAPHTEADPAALLFTFLVMAGNAVGRNPHTVAEADRHGLNLFAVAVGTSAKGRKGSSWGRIRDLLNRVDETWVQTRLVSGLSSGEGLIWAVRDGKGDDDDGVTDKRLMVHEGEFVNVLKVMAREGNTLSPLIRSAWDTGTLQSLVKHSPTRATGAHISILGHITKGELLRYLNDTEAGNGFANRFLFFCTKRAQVLPFGSDPPNYGALIVRLRNTLETVKTIDRVQWAEDGKAVWREVYADLSEGQMGLIGAVTARAEAQVLRLATLYAVLDGSTALHGQHITAALAVWDYAAASARYLFGDATGDPVADRVMEALRAAPAGLNRTDISALFGRHEKAARISLALGELLSLGRARCEVDREKEGRPVEWWFAVRGTGV